VLIVLTLLGSVIGARLLLIIPSKVVPVIVSIAIVGLAVFSMVSRHSMDLAPLPRRSLETAGYALTFLLGIYGGLFSGGYVTILTAIFVATFRMTFIEAIATTKSTFFRRELQRQVSCGGAWWIFVSEPFWV
jgi:uncharacterized protein